MFKITFESVKDLKNDLFGYFYSQKIVINIIYR